MRNRQRAYARTSHSQPRNSIMYILLRRTRDGSWTTELAAGQTAWRSNPGEIHDVVAQAHSAASARTGGYSPELNLRVFSNSPGGDHSITRDELLAIIEANGGCKRLYLD